jgi:soluble lytic murein transglycosylase-like protein
MDKIKFILLISAFFACFILYNNCENTSKYDLIIHKKIAKTDPPCLQMYFYIQKYANEYKIPLDYAFGLAYKETGYRGIFHWNYNHRKTSCVNAEGPMQIMLPTATWIAGEQISRSDLRNNIELNVRLSMKFLRYLHDKYNNWKLVFGAYNTGKPCINEYAKDIFNKNYIWDK